MAEANDLGKNPGCLGLFWMALRRWAREPDEMFLYQKQERMLSPAEERLYHALRQTVGNGRLIIMPKVRLADVFKVSISGTGRQGQFNRISAKHVDFLLCDRDTFKPLLGIELDDRSHERADRVERDRIVDRIFEAAELPLVHLPVKRSGYTVAEITKMLDEMLPNPPS